MSCDPKLLEQVRAAASAAGAASGNADAASFYSGQAEGQAEMLRQLEWAADNARIALSRINEALATARTLQQGGAQ